MVYELCLLEVRSCVNLVSGNLEICCFIALIKENLEIIWESFLNEKFTLESLVYGCKIVIGV